LTGKKKLTTSMRLAEIKPQKPLGHCGASGFAANDTIAAFAMLQEFKRPRLVRKGAA